MSSEVHIGESEDLWMNNALLKHCQEDQIQLSEKIQEAVEGFHFFSNPVVKVVAAVSRGVNTRRQEKTNLLVEHYTGLTNTKR